jgi:hypothetical protein
MQNLTPYTPTNGLRQRNAKRGHRRRGRLVSIAREAYLRRGKKQDLTPMADRARFAPPRLALPRLSSVDPLHVARHGCRPASRQPTPLRRVAELFGTPDGPHIGLRSVQVPCDMGRRSIDFPSFTFSSAMEQAASEAGRDGLGPSEPTRQLPNERAADTLGYFAPGCSNSSIEIVATEVPIGMAARSTMKLGLCAA